jgi:hypothetical protein
MNNLAVVPYVGMHALQIQNVKRNVVKKASISELNYEKKDLKEENTLKESLNNVNDTSNNVNDTSNNVNGTSANETGTSLNDLPEPSIEAFSNNSNLNISTLE